MEPLEVLQKVDAFYRTSWEHLLVFGGIAAFVVGIVVPFFFLLYQRRLFKLEEATVTQNVKAQVEQAKSALAEAYRQELASLRQEIAGTLATADKKMDGALTTLREEHAKELTNLRNVLDKKSAALAGAVFHVQAGWLANTRQFAAAAFSAFRAAIATANGADEGNLIRSLELLYDTCLPHVNRQQIEETREDVLGMMKTLEEALAPLNKTGRYRDPIGKLRAAMKAAQSR